MHEGFNKSQSTHDIPNNSHYSQNAYKINDENYGGEDNTFSRELLMSWTTPYAELNSKYQNLINIVK